MAGQSDRWKRAAGRTRIGAEAQKRRAPRVCRRISEEMPEVANSAVPVTSFPDRPSDLPEDGAEDDAPSGLFPMTVPGSRGTVGRAEIGGLEMALSYREMQLIAIRYGVGPDTSSLAPIRVGNLVRDRPGRAGQPEGSMDENERKKKEMKNKG